MRKRELAAWLLAAVLTVALCCGNWIAWDRWTRSGSNDDRHEVRELERIQILIREKEAAQQAGDADRAADLSIELHKVIDNLAAYHKAHR